MQATTNPNERLALLERLLKPTIAKAAAVDASDRSKRRLEILNGLHAATRARDERHAAAAERLATIRTKMVEAQRKLNELASSANAAAGEILLIGGERDHAVRTATKAIADLGGSLVDSAQAYLRRVHEAARVAGDKSLRLIVGEEQLGWRESFRPAWSSVDSIFPQTMRAALAARDEIEALRLEPITVDALEARITTIVEKVRTMSEEVAHRVPAWTPPSAT